MPDPREDARTQYSKTRAEFEKLGTQDKTAFVLEATFATLGQAIEDTGRQVADALDHIVNFDFGSWREEGSAPDAPNPAEPPTAKKRASTPRREKDGGDK